MSKTALVIGARGFIGSSLTPVLIERGFQIACIEPIANDLGRLTPWAENIELIKGSIENTDAITRIVSHVQPDVIVNLAFARGLNIASELDVMARGTWNVLEAAVAVNCQRVVLASSVRVYGPQRLHGYDVMLNEDSLVKPIIRYGYYKFLNEQVATDYRRKHGLEVSSLRIPMVYGPGVREGAYGVCIPALAAATGNQMTLPYDADAVLCLCHVGDVARAMADLGDPEMSAPQHGVYELGGQTASYRQMVDIAATLVDNEVQIDFKPDSRSTEHDFAYLLDNSRIEEEYAFKHRSLSDGYQSIIDHIQRKVF